MMHESLSAAGRCLLAGSVLFLAGCGESTGVGTPATFTADVRGARTERITGLAMAGSDQAVREFATEVTLPNVGTISVIALVGSDSRTISFSREGTELPIGTHRIGLGPSTAGGSAGRFSAGYSVRQPNGLRLSLADSGSITITESGSRVKGSFVFYATEYQVIPFPPTPDQVGKPITPVETGSEPLTISGTFDAARANARKL